MAEISYFTKEGYEKLKQELQELKSKGRSEIAKEISEAREKGDLSENAEYDAAKEKQGLLELKISKMEDLLASARIVDESEFDTSKVYILTKVRLKNLKTKQEVSYQLVTQQEANLAEGRISVDSPIGKGVLGKAVGEIAQVKAPAGTIEFEILEIFR